MLRVKTRLETVSAGRHGVSGGSSLGCAGETLFETAHATAGESMSLVRLENLQSPLEQTTLRMRLQMRTRESLNCMK